MADYLLTGKTGESYAYFEASFILPWNEVPGNYAFLADDNRVIYVGQTKDFSNRRPGPSHEKWALAVRYGAAKVVAHINQGGEAARKAEEADLIRYYNPPANEQLRPTAAPGLGFGKPGVTLGHGLPGRPRGLLSDW